LPVTASLHVFCVEIRWGVLAVRDFMNPQNSQVNNLVREVAHARKQNPLSDLDYNCRVVDIPDVITYENFGEDRLRGIGVAGLKFCRSPLTLIVALTTFCRTTVRVVIRLLASAFFWKQKGASRPTRLPALRQHSLSWFLPNFPAA